MPNSIVSCRDNFCLAIVISLFYDHVGISLCRTCFCKQMIMSINFIVCKQIVVGINLGCTCYLFVNKLVVGINLGRMCYLFVNKWSWVFRSYMLFVCKMIFDL